MALPLQIELDAVSKRFGRTHALRELSLGVEPGEVFGLIGPNGCGKTTTLRTLLGFYRPDAGRVTLLGKNPLTDFREIGPRLGVMLEQQGLCDHLTATEYLEYYGGVLGLSRQIASRRAQELLELVKLSTRREALRAFSKGMRQRVTLARCLVNRPSVLLLDEPFDGIDVETRRDMLELLPRVARENSATVFITSHNLPEIERVCDRVAVVNEGHVVGLGTTDDLRAATMRRRVIVFTLEAGSIPRNVAALVPDSLFDPVRRELRVTLAVGDMGGRNKILKTLVDHGVQVATMTEVGATLEDTYFALTSKDRAS